MNKQYYQNPNEKITIHLEKKFNRICWELSVIFRNYDSFDIETGMSSIGNYKGQDKLGKTSWFKRMSFIHFVYSDDEFTGLDSFVNYTFGLAMVNAVTDFVKSVRRRKEWLDNAFKSGNDAVLQAHYELMDIPFVTGKILDYFAAIIKTVVDDDLKNKNYEQIRAIFNDEVSPVLMLALSRRYNLNAKEVFSLTCFYGKTKEKKAETLELISNHNFFGMDSESKTIKKIFRKINKYDKKIT